MKQSIIQHTTTSTTILMGIVITTASTTAINASATATAAVTALSILSIRPPACMYVQDFPFIHHLGDAIKFFSATIHRYLINQTNTD